MTKRIVPITLSDGKPRHLFYGYNALIALVDTLGIPLDGIPAAMSGPGMLKGVRSVLWAGLIHEDEDLTPEAAGALLDGELYRIGEISALIAEAIGAAFGKPDGGPKNPETPETPVPAPSL